MKAPWLGIFTLCFLMLTLKAVAQDKGLDAFFDAVKATPDQRTAYTFAAQHPEVLKYIPCYCGCLKRGHKDNYNCFINDSNPKHPTFEFHGTECPMCVQIALESKRLYDQHVPLPKIRATVDAMYKQYPQLTPTPTPQPVQ